MANGHAAERGTGTRGARLRLALAAAAFLAWLGWLAYLAATATRPTVLSRPQLLVSTFDVLADVGAKDGKPDPAVTVERVYWPPREAGQHAKEKITVADLPTLAKDGWAGPGLYLLPLAREGDHYRVVAIPASPGYHDLQHRIYHVTERNRHQVEHQLKEIVKPAE